MYFDVWSVVLFVGKLVSVGSLFEVLCVVMIVPKLDGLFCLCDLFLDGFVLVFM